MISFFTKPTNLPCLNNLIFSKTYIATPIDDIISGRPLNNISIAKFQKSSIYELNFVVENRDVCGTIWGLLVINYGFYVALWHTKTLENDLETKFN